MTMQSMAWSCLCICHLIMHLQFPQSRRCCGFAIFCLFACARLASCKQSFRSPAHVTALMCNLDFERIAPLLSSHFCILPSLNYNHPTMAHSATEKIGIKVVNVVSSWLHMLVPRLQSHWLTPSYDNCI